MPQVNHRNAVKFAVLQIINVQQQVVMIVHIAATELIIFVEDAAQFQPQPQHQTVNPEVIVAELEIKVVRVLWPWITVHGQLLQWLFLTYVSVYVYHPLQYRHNSHVLTAEQIVTVHQQAAQLRVYRETAVNTMVRPENVWALTIVIAQPLQHQKE